MPQTILLPLDGEERGACAEYALDRAEREGGVVHALCVVDTPRYGEPALSSGEVLVDDAEDAARERLAAFADRAARRGVAVQTRCCHGRHPEELLAYARDIDADVVVCDRRLPHAVRTRLDEVVDTVITRPDRAAAA